MKPLLTSDEAPSKITTVGIDKKNFDIIKEAMRENVVTGSGIRLSKLGIPVAGKTGTAQFTSGLSQTHAWYTGFAPFGDPQIVITVLVEGGGEGHVTSVPVVFDALDWWSKNRHQK